jgi:cysteine desulfurase family protein (TIGR01976 family)
VNRDRFPGLAGGWARLDGPAGTQMVDSAIEAMNEWMRSGRSANHGGPFAAAQATEECVQDARAVVGRLIGADPRGVAFGPSMTAMTMRLSAAVGRTLAPGDEVVVTRLDHDANVRPWVQAAEARGATVRWAAFDPASGELEPDAVGSLLGERTRLVAVTGASNLIGTRPDLTAITGLAHDAGALTWIDGVHLTAHASIDVAALGADFFVCSPYKFLGPHCGCLVAAPDLLQTLHPDKLLPSTDAVPERFEFGTLPYELMAGTTAAVDFLASLAGTDGGRRERLVAAMDQLEQHEDRLRERVEEGLREITGATLWSRAKHRTPTLLVTFQGRDAAEAYRFLAARGVNAPAGSFYALEASRHLGLGDTGGLRIGLAPYSDDADVDRLLEGLREWAAA